MDERQRAEAELELLELEEAEEQERLTAAQAPTPQHDNWKKLGQLGGMATLGAEWGSPDYETINDPTVRESMKDQAKVGYGMALGGAAGEIPALTSGFVRRSLTGGAINATTNPEDPLRAFLTGTATGLGLEALAGGARAAYHGGKVLGTKMGGLSKQQANSFIASPQTADELANMAQHNPKALSDKVRERVGGGLEEAFDRTAQPAIDKVNRSVMNRGIRVRPDQFRGTEAGTEIKRSWDLRHPPREVRFTEVTPYEAQMTPVRPEVRKAGNQVQLVPEVPAVRMTPVEEKLHLGAPQEQSWFSGGPNPYQQPQIPVRSVDRTIEPAGRAVTLKPAVPAVRMSPIETQIVQSGPRETVGKGFTRGEQVITKTTPEPMGENVIIHGPQALRAMRASSKAASHNRSLNPLGYNPANDAEAAAAGRMSTALKEAVPGVDDAFEVLEESARHAGAAKAKFGQNPAAILTDSDSLGSIPTRQMRQYLDQHGDAGLEEMANALAAGRKLGPQDVPEGLWDTAKRVGSRGLLKGSAKADSTAQILRDMKLKALLSPSAPEKKKGDK